MWENHITPIFGWPQGVYSDNGSNFVNEPVQHMFRDHGVTHFTGPVSQPSSTGLLKRDEVDHCFRMDIYLGRFANEQM